MTNPNQSSAEILHKISEESSKIRDLFHEAEFEFTMKHTHHDLVDDGIENTASKVFTQVQKSHGFEEFEEICDEGDTKETKYWDGENLLHYMEEDGDADGFLSKENTFSSYGLRFLRVLAGINGLPWMECIKLMNFETNDNEVKGVFEANNTRFSVFFDLHLFLPIEVFEEKIYGKYCSTTNIEWEIIDGEAVPRSILLDTVDKKPNVKYDIKAVITIERFRRCVSDLRTIKEEDYGVTFIESV